MGHYLVSITILHKTIHPLTKLYERGLTTIPTSQVKPDKETGTLTPIVAIIFLSTISQKQWLIRSSDIKATAIWNYQRSEIKTSTHYL